jgi:hypothetical protein
MLTCGIAVVGDDFILYLFQIIEELADDADDPYHYPTIRVLVRIKFDLGAAMVAKLTLL